MPENTPTDDTHASILPGTWAQYDKSGRTRPLDLESLEHRLKTLLADQLADPLPRGHDPAAVSQYAQALAAITSARSASITAGPGLADDVVLADLADAIRAEFYRPIKDGS